MKEMKKIKFESTIYSIGINPYFDEKNQDLSQLIEIVEDEEGKQRFNCSVNEAIKFINREINNLLKIKKNLKKNIIFLKKGEKKWQN